MSDLTGKVFAVTGGASGIGLETAKLLATRGAKVSIADIQEESLEEAGAAIRGAGGDAFTFRLDVRDRKQVDTWIEKTVAHFGRLDGAANVAGVSGKDMFKAAADELDDEDWEFVLSINLTGVMYCQRAELRNLRSGGSIVNVSSRAVEGVPKASAYSVSKCGILGLTRCAAREMGARGIRVNAVAPGATETPMLLGSAEAKAKLMASSKDRSTLQRIGQPSEIARLIVFLLSDEASFITGQTVHIDGGVPYV